MESSQTPEKSRAPLSAKQEPVEPVKSNNSSSSTTKGSSTSTSSHCSTHHTSSSSSSQSSEIISSDVKVQPGLASTLVVNGLPKTEESNSVKEVDSSSSCSKPTSSVSSSHSGSEAADHKGPNVSESGSAKGNSENTTEKKSGLAGSTPSSSSSSSSSSNISCSISSSTSNSSSSKSSSSSGGGVRTVSIDSQDVRAKLNRLFAYWSGHYAAAAAVPSAEGAAVAGDCEAWQSVDALAVLIGRASGDEEEGRNEQLQMWLTGFQFPETLFVFTRTGEWLVLTSAKKLEHLRQIENCREGITLLPRNAADNSAAALATIEAAIFRAAAAAGKSPHEALLGRLQQSVPVQQQGAFAQHVDEILLKKFAENGKTKYVDEGLIITMAVHTAADLESLRAASAVAVAMLKTQIVDKIETVLDNEQQESHAAIAALAEKLLKDGKQLEKLKEKYQVDPAEIDLLYSNVQSGETFDLRASAQPTNENLSPSEGSILVSLGVKYKELCAAIARTFLLNGTKEQKETYLFALEVFQRVLTLLQPGTAFSTVYMEVKRFIEKKKPDLSSHFGKMCGHCLGLDYRTNALVFNARNSKAVVERGMTFNICVGFSHLKTAKNKPFAVWLSDTVHLPLEKDQPPQVLTDGMSKVLRHISYELEDADETEQQQQPEETKKSESASSDAAAARSSGKERKKKREGEEDSSGKSKKSGAGPAYKSKESTSNSSSKTSASATAAVGDKEQRKSTGSGGAISATILNNAESVILRDRLRRRTGAQAAMQQQEAEERDERQRQLRKKKLEQLRLRFDNEKEGGGLERKKKEGKKMEDIRCFKNPEEFPRDLKSNKLYVDFKSESLLVPIHGSHVPFHLSTVKNVTCSEAERQSDSSSSSSLGSTSSGLGSSSTGSKGRTQFFVLRVNFQVPGSQTLTLKGEENPLPDLSGQPETVFVKELMFKSEDGRHLQTIYRTIKEQLKRVKQKALEDNVAGEMAEQDKLILNRTGRRVLLKDLMIRPNIAPGMRKLIGSLEAHTNGLRFTVNTRGQMDQVDITYSNIKHAMFQPCERELIVLIHFHMKSAIMVGKKRTQDVQFYTEAGTQTDDLDNRRNRSFHDPDETQDEMRERELKRRLNNEFKRFVQQVEDIAKIEFDLPYRELRFTGVPMKSNVEILPTANCLVHLIEWPPFVLPLEDIELVSFERVAHGLRNFDVIFVFQDYAKPVRRIDLVPIEFLDNLKRWLNELEIVWYEGKQNLNWNAILKQIRDDPQGFVEAGGFDMFLGEDGPSGEEGDSDEDDDDEEYAESESGSEYKEASGEDDEEGDESAEDDSSDDSDDDDDESLADESDEDDEYNEVSSDEEEGLSWDELEERAKKEDRKRRAEDSDEHEDRRKKKKKK